MTANLHTLDRIVRIAFAVIVATLYILGHLSGTAAIVLGIVALVLLLTGLVNFCPLYSALGISTKPKS